MVLFSFLLFGYQIEDEVNVSECELQDISVAPMLNALHTHKGVAMLDLSHNLLGDKIFSLAHLHHSFRALFRLQIVYSPFVFTWL